MLSKHNLMQLWLESYIHRSHKYIDLYPDHHGCNGPECFNEGFILPGEK